MPTKKEPPNLGENFFDKLVAISQKNGINPRDLLLVMFSESGVDPAAKNAQGGATGLIQFMPHTLKNMGLSTDDISGFSKKSGEEQLDFVDKYLSWYKKWPGAFDSAARYYHANFYPITMKRGSSPDTVVVAKNATSKSERKAYEANYKAFDPNGKGYITLGDLDKRLQQGAQSGTFKNLEKQLNDAIARKSSSDYGQEFKNSPPTNPIEQQVKPQSKEEEHKMPSTEEKPGPTIMQWFSSFLDKVASAKPENKIIIELNSDSPNSSIEFARILNCALKEEFGIKSNTYCNDNKIEVIADMNISGCFMKKAVKDFTVALSSSFELATNKVGGIKVNPLFKTASNSNLIDLDRLSLEYRKFQLRMIQGQNGS